MKKHLFKTTKTAVVNTIGTIDECTNEIWICLHGYGQRSDFFAKKFEPLSSKQRFIIVPEALNRFYLQGFSGKTGATWMTAYERTSEIGDYVDYLNNCVNYFTPNFNGRIVVFSFSQGVATASRWIANTKLQFTDWIVWSGTLAVDIDHDAIQKLHNNLKISLFLGNEDEFIPLHKQPDFINNFKACYPFASIYQYNGGHKIDFDFFIEKWENMKY